MMKTKIHDPEFEKLQENQTNKKKNQQPIMDNQQNIEKIIRQTNITTRKVRKMQ